MAWPQTLLFALAVASPAAVALQARVVTGDVNVPEALLLALHHDTEKCSARVPRSMLHQKAAERQNATRRARKGHLVVPEQQKAKSALQRIFYVRAVDFTGTWVMDKVEGDMDKMLMKMGMSAMDRSAAHMFNYGIGKVTEEIKQSGDDIAITTKSALGTAEEKHYIAGEETQMEMKGAGKKRKKSNTIKCKTSWADASKDELVHETKASGGKKLPQLRRTLAGDNMILKMILDGVEVTVTYKRQ